jgi:hypothetical protein
VSTAGSSGWTGNWHLEYGVKYVPVYHPTTVTVDVVKLEPPVFSD